MFCIQFGLVLFFNPVQILTAVIQFSIEGFYSGLDEGSRF